MTIIAPQPPHVAILLRDGDSLLGATDMLPLAEARKQLTRIRAVYPDATLADYGFDSPEPLSDEHADLLVYRHTLHVAQALTDPSLPLAHWRAVPYRPDHLHAGLHLKTEEASREGLAAFAKALGIDPASIIESTSDHGLHLGLPEVIWAGVRIEVQAYVPKHELVRAEPVECVDCESAGRTCSAHAAITTAVR
ncbi:hypothetical protein ACIBG7_18805 [Nonomuraea sp. NPDC050328]|uniref:hypothetical protein n=1 Tax=Nonomuraea sp. NPDC050328 TaxID=3364361 RepID=UPI0037AB4070